MTLENERRALEEQRRTLERERREFTRRVEIEDRRLEQQQKLFEMKFKILEEELVKLATEKEQVQKQKAFYQRVHDFEFFSSGATRKNVPKNNVVKGEMFFSGVESKQSLKKRYKDLIILTIWTGIPIRFRRSTVSIINFVRCTKYRRVYGQTIINRGIAESV